MLEIKGKSVFGGIAIGKIHICQRKKRQIQCRKVQDTDREISRYAQARDVVGQQLKGLYEKALQEVGMDGARIFEMYQLMLEDESYRDTVENIIRVQAVNAEYAVSTAADSIGLVFASMEDEYMKAREADVRDVSERLLLVLEGRKADSLKLEEASIIVAEDLTPSETVQMDKSNILAIVTKQGSVNSHTAILARTMGIPALVGADVCPEDLQQGKVGIVDGTSGIFYVDPTEEILAELQKKQKEEKQSREKLQNLKDKEDVTLDGHKIMLCANIGHPGDIPAVIENGAAGIGLFRSEFVYLEKNAFPTEEDQFQVYKFLAEAMGDKKVIIRTLDIGADKQCDYFGMEPEKNPALGCRGIRFCLTRPDIFIPQLRAILRASVYGNIEILYPMITGMEEVKAIQKLVSEVKESLTREGIAFGNPKQGIMIETPAAVMISESLAKEVDFFSIGTNDLTQYTLAIDRENSYLEALYNPYHPAILPMISMVVENAHKAGITVGICGELGADAGMLKTFLKMGVDELSVSPANILPLRKMILETRVDS